MFLLICVFHFMYCYFLCMFLFCITFILWDFSGQKKKQKILKGILPFYFFAQYEKHSFFLKQGMVFFKSLCMQTLSPRPFFLYKMFYFWLLSVHGNIFLLHKNIFFSSIYFLAFLSFRVFRWIIIRIIIQKNVKKNSLD